MADKTNYYYLKIKENFFDSEEMKILESLDNGYLYSNILMKMYLLSLKNGGKLVYRDKIPYNLKMLSTILGHNIDILEKAIKVFKELNLIEVLDSGAIFMLDIQNFIGKSSDEADRKRAYRNNIEMEKRKLIETNLDNCPDISRTNCSNIKDIDKDIDKDINNIYANDDEEIVNNDDKINILRINFEKFWKAYPKKTDKAKALKWFEKNKPDDNLVNFMIKQVNRFKDTQEWKKSNGQFIPYPTTWLNGRRWEDEFETDSEKDARIEREIENDIN